jgi:hypothetical protein
LPPLSLAPPFALSFLGGILYKIYFKKLLLNDFFKKEKCKQMSAISLKRKHYWRVSEVKGEYLYIFQDIFKNNCTFSCQKNIKDFILNFNQFFF